MVWWGNVEERDRLEDIGEDGKIQFESSSSLLFVD
jgi:hypothetical protein